MMAHPFGTRPYKGGFYGANLEAAKDLVPSDGNRELSELQRLLQRLKHGEFGEVAKLGTFLDSKDYDVRQYACQLFADVCTHQQVEELKRSLVAAEDLHELRRIIMNFGFTLSPASIHIILEFRTEVGDSSLDDHVRDAIGIVFGFPARELDLDDVLAIAPILERAGRPPVDYYFKGNPVVIGDVTKEVVTASLISRRENRPLMIGLQHYLLSTFTGVKCPVAYGDVVDDSQFAALTTYVQDIAAKDWSPGKKYFYGHLIEGK